MLNFASNWGPNDKRRSRFTAICHGLIWCLRNFRNNRLFNQVIMNSTNGVDYIKSTMFLWIKSSGKWSVSDWKDWISSPFILV
ncbi:hypothetical protein LXL04_021560 [Taraxacum kok-saghyz]